MRTNIDSAMKTLLRVAILTALLLLAMAAPGRRGHAQTCSLRQVGTVNSGSGIAVSFNWSDGRAATSYRVTRAGIHFDYPGTARAHSEVAGCGFSAGFTVEGHYSDGSTCTINSTGPQPHTAPCTDANVAFTAVAINAASYSDTLAPGAIVAIFGTGFSAQSGAATSLPLPTSLAGVKVYTFFNTPLQRECGLFFVGEVPGMPGIQQVNAKLPDDLPYGGLGTLAVVNLAADTLRPSSYSIDRFSPGMFTASQDGHGVAAGYWDRGYRVLYGTGFGDATGGFLLSGITHYEASFVGPAPGFAGLTQINVQAPLPAGAYVQFCASRLGVAEARCSQFFLLP